MKKTFNEYLSIMNDFDDDLSELTIEEFTQMVHEDLADKIDDCKNHIDTLESRELFLKERIRELSEAKKQIENAKKRFKEYLTFAMDSKDIKKVQGKTYNLAIQSRVSVTPKVFAIDDDLFTAFNSMQDGMVKKTYSLDSKAFKAHCKENETFKEMYAEENETSFPMFRVRK